MSQPQLSATTWCPGAQALAKLERAFGPKDVRVAQALSNTAACFVSQHRIPDAQANMERALQVRQPACSCPVPPQGKGWLLPPELGTSVKMLMPTVATLHPIYGRLQLCACGALA